MAASFDVRDRLKHWLDAMMSGDGATVMGGLAEDVTFTSPIYYRPDSILPVPGTATGKADIAATFAARERLVETLSVDLRAYGGDGLNGWALVAARERHKPSGHEYAIETAVHFTFGEDGLIHHWQSYFDPSPQIAAFRSHLDTALVDALWARDGATVRECLRVGADANARDPANGLTALMVACGCGLDDLAALLLEHGADPFAKDSRAGASAIHKACQAGSLACARLLIEAGVPVDEPATSTGHTPLIEAIWFKRPDIAGYLLDHGAGLHVTTHYGFSLLDHMNYALNVNQIHTELLQQAAGLVRAREAKDQAAVAAQVLMAAVVAGDLDKVKSLLAAGAAVDQRTPVLNGFNDDHTPLLVACRDGHGAIAEVLLAAGADVNAIEPTFGAVPLHKATYNGHTDIAALLARQPGVNLDFQGPSNGYTPLHDAIWHGFDACARVLVEAGARLDLLGHDGKTPLDLARETFGDGHALTDLIRDRAATS
ncbi:MAG: ankyrin repeat domain-containing protein [Rhodospirillaceae bacterium]|nr:ankyrin repeat domain-containing protein [Rhodospirillaceae bacterium]